MMTTKEFDLNLLMAFEAIWKEGSVTRAARRLGIGQPAMSATLARLRVMLGDPLFERVGAAMVPSAAARDMAPDLLASLDGLREAVRRRRVFSPSHAHRTFTCASTDYTSMIMVPGVVQRMLDAAPTVRLRVIGYDKDEVAALLDGGVIDLALGVFPNPPPSVVAQPLYRETFVGVARSDHPALDDGSISLKDFVTLPHALVTVRKDARGFIDEALEARGLTRQVALTLPHMMALPDVLAGADMIAVLPGRMASRLGPSLCTFALPITTEPWTVQMLWHPNQRTDPGSRWLRQLVASAAATA
jgi:DNA-binding transcriptional LysR family regulator